MPNTNTITTAAYRELAADDQLGSLATVYKGMKRPVNAPSPAVTVQTKRLEPGEGEGIWMCDIIVTVFVETLANRMIDQETHDAIAGRIQAILDDAELELDQGHPHPLIPGGMPEPEWRGSHDRETVQELTYGLVFLDFGVPV